MGGFSIVNNLASLVARQQAEANSANLQKTLFRLSSGLRLVNGAVDPAGLAIADGLRGQIRTLQQSVRNANDGVGFVQVADSALDRVQNLLTRAASLLSEAASGTNAGQQTQIENELGQIFSEINRVGSATTFNGTAVFSATSLSIFVGDTTNTAASTATISLTASALSVSGLGVTSTAVTGSSTNLSVDITTSAGKTATDLLDQVKLAIDSVATKRGKLGAQTNRLENAVSVIQAQIQNLTAAESQIRDANVAEEVANLTKFQILSQTSLASIAQANQASQSVLSLFR